MAPLSTKREHAEYNIRSHCHFSVVHLKSVCKALPLGLNPFVAFTPAEASAYDVRCVHMNYKKMREGCSPFPIVLYECTWLDERVLWANIYFALELIEILHLWSTSW